MSLQWHATTGLLYALIAITSLMLSRLISMSVWNKILQSSLVRNFANASNYFFNTALTLLVLVFFQAIHDNYRRSQDLQILKDHPESMRTETETMLLMRLFRSHRNFYISMFTIYCWFVLKNLICIISKSAQDEANAQASIKQAKNASETARKLMEGGDNTVDKKKFEEIQKKLDQAIKEKEKALKDLETMKKQSEQLTKEYDRAAEECRELHKKIDALSGNPNDKKKD